MNSSRKVRGSAAGRPQRRRSGNILTQRPRPVWLVALFDVVLIGVALVVFALFHHVLPSKAAPAAVPTPPPVEETEDAEQTEALSADAEVTAMETPVDELSATGDFSAKFADRFTDGPVEKTADSYRSKNLNITITHGENGYSYYVADVYVRDAGCFHTAFAKDEYGKNITEPVADMAQKNFAVLTVNGDYYGVRKEGPVLRNGTVYREDVLNSMDVCVLYSDGTLKTFAPQDFEIWREYRKGAMQIWSFGPKLLDEEGRAMTEFNSGVERSNPRTAIGYYEPGHYCCVVVDGRDGSSNGCTLKALSSFMEHLGCKCAFNLDGGRSSVCVFNGEIVNNPDRGGRYVSDVLFFSDEITRREGETA